MVERTPAGTFAKGTSGNLKGRPLNSGHRQKLFNALVEPHKEELVKTAINLALNGNDRLLVLLIERILPPKPADDYISIELPELNSREEIQHFGFSVLKHMSDSAITPAEAKNLMLLLDMQMRLISDQRVLDQELSDEMRRIKSELEEKFKKDY